MTRKEARFAVGTRTGPRSTIWKAWVHNEEAYLASRMFGCDLKVSLHSSGACHWSATDHWVRSQPAVRNADRHIVRWQVTHPHGPESLLLLRVAIPVSEVRVLPPPTDRKKVFWVDGAPPESTVQFLFYLTRPLDREPSAPSTDRMRHLFSLGLRNRRWLVVFVEVISLSPEDLAHARRTVRAELAAKAPPPSGDLRMCLFSEPSATNPVPGFIELCAHESSPTLHGGVHA